MVHIDILFWTFNFIILCMTSKKIDWQMVSLEIVSSLSIETEWRWGTAVLFL